MIAPSAATTSSPCCSTSTRVVRGDPKPFFGYSDNTNLLNYLCTLGLPAFHGGA